MSNFKLLVLDATTIGAIDREVCESFDRLGKESGQAQNLTGPISSTEKLLTGDSSAVVAVREDGAAIGFAKFGFKSLYIYKKDGKVVECPRSPCLLDFYVSADLQRQGLGLVLFREAVKLLGVSSEKQIAYDRPSPKLVAFLARHFDLRGGDLQPNRFMIFEGFL